jgi:hypothetical protein
LNTFGVFSTVYGLFWALDRPAIDGGSTGGPREAYNFNEYRHEITAITFASALRVSAWELKNTSCSGRIFSFE